MSPCPMNSPESIRELLGEPTMTVGRPRALSIISKRSELVNATTRTASTLDCRMHNDLDSELVCLFEVIRDDVDGVLKRADFLL